MKRLGKIELTNVDILDASEMKHICGGKSGYRCACGMGMDTYFVHWDYDSLEQALDWVSSHCEGGVGGCFLDD